jgi:hypothetical protein
VEDLDLVAFLRIMHLDRRNVRPGRESRGMETQGEPPPRRRGVGPQFREDLRSEFRELKRDVLGRIGEAWLARRTSTRQWLQGCSGPLQSASHEDGWFVGNEGEGGVEIVEEC